MTTENSVTPEASQSATPPKQAAKWSEHEHVSEQVQGAAKNLVDLVGSSELAKHAINVVDQTEAVASVEETALAAKVSVKQADHFKQALDGFETSLETPVVSGELIGWVTEARRTLQQLSLLLNNDVPRTHAQLYATILREDLELASRVKELQATDEQLLRVELDKVEGSLSQLFNQAQLVAQDELKAAKLREDVVKLSLAFVISLRTQETAITTWFGEAFNRDRGVGD